MQRTKRFIEGAIFGYLSQALIMVAGVWVTPLLLSKLGNYDYGIWLIGIQTLGYLTLGDFGILGIVPRIIAYETGQAGRVVPEAIAGRLGSVTRILLAQTAMLTLAALGVWAWLSIKWPDLAGPGALILAGFVLLFPAKLLGAMLEGFQESGYGARAYTLSWALGILTNVLLVVAGWKLYALAIGWLVTQVTISAMYALRVFSHYRETLPTSFPPVDWTETIELLRRGFWITVSQLHHILVNGTDVMLIGHFLSPAAVVVYSCTAKLISALANQPQLLMQLAMPGLSELSVSGQSKRTLNVVLALGQATLLLSGALGLVVLAVNEGFIRWWVGPQFYAGTFITVLLVAKTLTRHLSLTYVYAAFSFGYERRLAIAGLVDGVVTVGTTVVLLPRLGLAAALIGPIAGVVFALLPMLLPLIARHIGCSIREVVMPMAQWVAGLSLLGVVVITFGRLIHPESVLQLIATAWLALTIYACGIIPIALRSDLGPYIRRQTSQFFGWAF